MCEIRRSARLTAPRRVLFPGRVRVVLEVDGKQHAEIGIKAVEHLLGTFTAARIRLRYLDTRCADCGSYRVVGGTCGHCGWVDPDHEAPDVTPKAKRRRKAEERVHAEFSHLEVHEAGRSGVMPSGGSGPFLTGTAVSFGGGGLAVPLDFRTLPSCAVSSGVLSRAN